MNQKSEMTRFTHSHVAEAKDTRRFQSVWIDSPASFLNVSWDDISIILSFCFMVLFYICICFSLSSFVYKRVICCSFSTRHQCGVRDNDFFFSAELWKKRIIAYILSFNVDSWVSTTTQSKINAVISWHKEWWWRQRNGFIDWIIRRVIQYREVMVS